MALLTTQAISKAGVTPTYVAATGGGDTITPGASFLVVKNGGAGITVTITPVGTTTYGVALPAHTVSVAGAGEKWINLNDPNFINATGVIPVTYSAVATVTVGVFLV